MGESVTEITAFLLNRTLFFSRDSYLDVNYALRKVVCLLKPSKHIEHDANTGNMKIKTVTTFKNFDMDFTLGKEFTEDLGPVDGRKCQVC